MDQLVATGAQRRRGVQRLEQQHAGGVGNHDLTGGGAQDGRTDLVTHLLRQVDPVRPAADEVARPVLAVQPLQRGHGGQRGPAETVAVEVGHGARLEGEALPESGQGVLGVQPGCVGHGDQCAGQRPDLSGLDASGAPGTTQVLRSPFPAPTGTRPPFSGGSLSKPVRVVGVHDRSRSSSAISAPRARVSK